ncbi:MAG TPA: papain-like cysteine protease family protein [Blastocatellia bacterium]|nr:papain-like cysteine protease family protein [Blastocatellia bacterium]
MPVGNSHTPITPSLLPQSKVLPVAHFQQARTQWCWAACAEMVLDYYSKRVHQCALANHLLGRKNCCAAPGPLHFFSKCNRNCQVAQVAQLYSHYGLNSLYQANPVSFSVIQAEINADQPVEVGFAWFGGGGHLAIIRGWEQDSIGDWVRINDPHYSPGNSGQGRMLHSKLATPYGLGNWVTTWTDLR